MIQESLKEGSHAGAVLIHSFIQLIQDDQAAAPSQRSGQILVAFEAFGRKTQSQSNGGPYLFGAGTGPQFNKGDAIGEADAIRQPRPLPEPTACLFSQFRFAHPAKASDGNQAVAQQLADEGVQLPLPSDKSLGPRPQIAARQRRRDVLEGTRSWPRKKNLGMVTVLRKQAEFASFPGGGRLREFRRRIDHS